jgi:hypothetical protein
VGAVSEEPEPFLDMPVEVCLTKFVENPTPRLVLGAGNPGYEEPVHVDPVPSAPAVGSKSTAIEEYRLPLNIAIALVELRLQHNSIHECVAKFADKHASEIELFLCRYAKEINAVMSERFETRREARRLELLRVLREGAVDGAIVLRRKVKLSGATTGRMYRTRCGSWSIRSGSGRTLFGCGRTTLGRSTRCWRQTGLSASSRTSCGRRDVNETECSVVPNAHFRDYEVRKGRKCYQCCECGGVIEVGEGYNGVVGKSDGEFVDWKFCTECWTISSEIIGSHEFDDDEWPGLDALVEDYPELKERYYRNKAKRRNWYDEFGQARRGV